MRERPSHNKALASGSCSDQREPTCEPESWAGSLTHLGLAGGSCPGEISILTEGQGQEIKHKNRLLLKHWLKSVQGRGCTGPQAGLLPNIIKWGAWHSEGVKTQTQANGTTGASPRDQREVTGKPLKR